MNTFMPTTIVVGTGGAIASTVLTRVGTEEGKKKRRNAFLGTAVASAGTAIVGQSLSCKSYNDYYKHKMEAEMSRKEYVDSLTNEELANALRQMEQQTDSIENSNVESNGNYRK